MNIEMVSDRLDLRVEVNGHYYDLSVSKGDCNILCVQISGIDVAEDYDLATCLKWTEEFINEFNGKGLCTCCRQ